MDQPIFYDDAFIAALNRNDLNMAYKILKTSYQIIYEEIQTNRPKTVQELKDKIAEKTVVISQMCEQAKQQTEKYTTQVEEQEKSIPDLQQMFDITEKKLGSSAITFKTQLKEQKEENAILKKMYNTIQMSQEDEFNAILEEAQAPLEKQLEDLVEKKNALNEEVGNMKNSAANKEDLAKIEAEFQEVKAKLEADIKDIQQKISAKNAELQKQQNEVDALVEQAKQKDVLIQRMNDEMIKKDTEIKKLKAELEGRIVDSYA
ncbi:Uncharacterized protein QTN25_003549 [Entamoeba marina]